MQMKHSTTEVRHDGIGIPSESQPFAVVNKTKTNTKSMKTIKNLKLVTVTTVTVLAVALLFQIPTTRAVGQDGTNNDNGLADLYELEQAFHLAASYGGDIDAMMALWSDDCIMTSGTSVFTGKEAVRAAIAAGGPFHNYWIGLTPAFTITADIHGYTAEFSFQCAYVDPSVTPNVVRLNRGLSGTVKRVNGQWLLWHMDSHPATL
jgi:hypothetical protein